MAKSARRGSAANKTDEAVTTAADRSGILPANLSALVTDGDIACRAYDLYLARGREHGHDVDDWLQAERELQRDSEC